MLWVHQDGCWGPLQQIAYWGIALVSPGFKNIISDRHISYTAIANALITQLVFGEDLMEALEEAKAVSTQFY
jgi:hypothetical protein